MIYYIVTRYDSKNSTYVYTTLYYFMYTSANFTVLYFSSKITTYDIDYFMLVYIIILDYTHCVQINVYYLCIYTCILILLYIIFSLQIYEISKFFNHQVYNNNCYNNNFMNRLMQQKVHLQHKTLHLVHTV